MGRTACTEFQCLYKDAFYLSTFFVNLMSVEVLLKHLNKKVLCVNTLRTGDADLRF